MKRGKDSFNLSLKIKKWQVMWYDVINYDGIGWNMMWHDMMGWNGMRGDGMGWDGLGWDDWFWLLSHFIVVQWCTFYIYTYLFFHLHLLLLFDLWCVHITAIAISSIIRIRSIYILIRNVVVILWSFTWMSKHRRYGIGSVQFIKENGRIGRRVWRTWQEGWYVLYLLIGCNGQVTFTTDKKRKEKKRKEKKRKEKKRKEKKRREKKRKEKKRREMKSSITDFVPSLNSSSFPY